MILKPKHCIGSYVGGLMGEFGQNVRSLVLTFAWPSHSNQCRPRIKQESLKVMLNAAFAQTGN